jgi:hypothetical protein
VHKIVGATHFPATSESSQFPAVGSHHNLSSHFAPDAPPHAAPSGAAIGEPLLTMRTPPKANNNDLLFDRAASLATINVNNSQYLLVD